MRVLVTGASGHVGGAVARHLVAAGHDVVTLGRRFAKIRGLAGTVLEDLGRPGLLGRMEGSAPCDAVVHAAASLAREPHDVSLSLVNGSGTQELLALAERWDVRSFVFVSGVHVIGRPEQLPVTEEHPAQPPSAYHASKLFGEHLTALAAARGLPAATLRLTAPVGPGLAHDRVLAVFARRAADGEPLVLAGQGGRRQDYVDVRDAARAVEACLARSAEGTYNVGSGVPVSNRQLAERCVAALGSSSAIELSGRPDPDEELSWEVSIARAAEALEWAPRHDLEEAIALAAAGE